MTFSPKISGLFAALAVLTLLSGGVLAQGYDGVLAPEDEKGAATESGLDPANDGYSGLIAPSKQAPERPDDKEPGYAGVVPGDVPSSTEPPARNMPAAAKPAQEDIRKAAKEYGGKFTPVERKPKVTSPYGNTNKLKARTAEDLQMLSTLYAHDKNADGIADKYARNYRLPESMTKILNAPRPRIDGMLPVEHTFKQSIDASLAEVKAGRQNPDEVVTQLKNLREGLRAKRGVSDGVYKTMGLPDIYIKEEREGLDAALDRVDAAIKSLGG